jgi:hypothetical protein
MKSRSWVVLLGSIGLGLVLLAALGFLLLIRPRLRAARGGEAKRSR